MDFLGKAQGKGAENCARHLVFFVTKKAHSRRRRASLLSANGLIAAGAVFTVQTTYRSQGHVGPGWLLFARQCRERKQPREQTAERENLFPTNRNPLPRPLGPLRSGAAPDPGFERNHRQTSAKPDASKNLTHGRRVSVITHASIFVFGRCSIWRSQTNARCGPHFAPGRTERNRPRPLVMPHAGTQRPPGPTVAQRPGKRVARFSP